MRVLNLLVISSVMAAASAFSLTMKTDSGAASRRNFLAKTATTAVALVAAPAAFKVEPANAAAQVFATDKGVKYAVLKDAKGPSPQNGDIVAIEYTGYLVNGQIFDATHSVGKQNALTFFLGGNAVIPGINEMVANMSVGQKVQAIIPPELAFGDKGLCLDDGECLIKPGSTLVYDIYLKKSSIPPP